MPKQHTFAGRETETTPETKAAALGMKKAKTEKAAEAESGTGELIEGVGELVENPWLALILLPAFVWSAWSKWQSRRRQR